MGEETTPLLATDASHDTGNGSAEGSTSTVRKKRSSQFLPWVNRRKSSRRSTHNERDVERHEVEANLKATAFESRSYYGQEPTFRERLAFYFDTSMAGRWWEAIDLLLNVAFVSLYIYNTGYARNGEVPMELHKLDFMIASAILIQWLPRFWLTLDPTSSTSLFSFLSILATVPVIFVHTYFRGEATVGTYMSAGPFAILYPFRFWRLHLAVLKIVKPNRFVFLKLSAITQKSIAITLTIFNLLLTVTAFVHMVERTQSVQELQFWEVYYWIFVTSSSGLSTKIVPDDLISRLVIIFVMINGVVFLPPALSELIELFKARSKFVHSYKPYNDHDHVVVLGELETNSVKDFLREFFCEDHGPSTMSTRVVMMNPEEPSEGLKMLLDDPLYANRVTYIKGSAMSSHDLKKTKISRSKACFILSSNYADRDSSEVDAEAVMRAISVKKFSRSTMLYVQVVLPPNKLHFDSLAEHVLCLDEFKLGVIAQNCIASGFTTLINILITSVPAPSIRSFNRSYNVKKGGNWVKEYVDGLNNEIYTVRLSPLFKGLTFKSAAERVYLRHHIILFAIAHSNADEDTEYDIFTDSILMNPCDYVLKGGEKAYMIAMDAFTADVVASNGEWLFEGNENGELEWEREWLFEVIEDGEEEESVFKKWSRKVTKAVNWNRNENSAPGTPIDAEGPSSIPSVEADLAKTPPPKEALKVDVAATPTGAQLLPPFTEEPDSTTPESPSKSRSDLVFMGEKGTRKDSEPENLEMALAPEPIPLKPPTFVSAKAEGKKPVKAPQFTLFGARYDTPAVPESIASSPVSPTNPAELSDHLLICSLSDEKFPSNLSFLIAPIRLRFPDMGIVLLAPVEPEEDERAKLLVYGLVFIVNGSCLGRSDLKKCGVEKVKKAVVLAAAKESNSTEKLADAPALLAVLNIEAMAKSDVFITVEFLHPSNMKLIGAGEAYYAKLDIYGSSIMPAFASGHVFSKSMLNTLLVQTYYNPHLLVILKHLIFSYRSYSQRHGSLGSTSNLFPSGSNSHLDQDHTEHGQIFKIKIPKKYYGQKYGLLFVRCLREMSALCIALYRTDTVQEHEVKFLCANPSQETRLRKGDSVFLLAGSQPCL
ncbi:hypothetical protein HDU97_009968 [Phlyctochytrium planicorne]|nr:hypothetical protein HDU97_009968 [Phlyctochytrium planicorne]